VVGVRNFPENSVVVTVMDLPGMTNRNVAIDLAMNEEDGNARGGDRIFGGNLIHVQVVLPADLEESKFDDGAKEGASEPWADMKGLAHAVVRDFMKSGEGRLRSHGTEARLDGERLQKFGGTHGFSESEDAVRMILGGEKIKPLANIIALEEPVGCECTLAGTVSAGVGKKNVEAVSEEKLGVSSHPDAIVAEAVQKNDGVAVTAMRMDIPGAKGDGIWRGDRNIFEI
jgi:hypothetical protein